MVNLTLQLCQCDLFFCVCFFILQGERYFAQAIANLNHLVALLCSFLVGSLWETCFVLHQYIKSKWVLTQKQIVKGRVLCDDL